MENITGKRFQKLVILEMLPNIPYKLRRCKAVCDCGNIIECDIGNVKRGVTRSCGCMRKGIHVKHGLSKSRLYGIYNKMIKRCSDPNNAKYSIYGARGIRVCEEWRSDFINFYNWANENGYKEFLTLDRIENEGNYEPINCRWVDAKTQANNRRSNLLLTYKQETKTLTQWADILKFNAGTVWGRLKNGWSIEESFEIPFDRRGNVRKRA